MFHSSANLDAATHHQNRLRGAVPLALYARNLRNSTPKCPTRLVCQMRMASYPLRGKNPHTLGTDRPTDLPFHLLSQFSWLKVFPAHHVFDDDPCYVDEFARYCGQRNDSSVTAARIRRIFFSLPLFGGSCVLENIPRIFFMCLELSVRKLGGKNPGPSRESIHFQKYFPAVGKRPLPRGVVKPAFFSRLFSTTPLFFNYSTRPPTTVLSPCSL